jgi:predicted nucleic acid-binding protein
MKKKYGIEKLRSRETYLYFQIDTNRINSRGSLVNMNRLEKWRDDGVIGLLMSDVAHVEAKAGQDTRRSRKVVEYIYSLSYKNAPGAIEIQARVGNILFPQGFRKANDKKDLLIVCNAMKYGYILVTADGHLLRSRDQLQPLGLKVLTDAEAVALVEEAIRERDEEARGDAVYDNEPLPWWVGQD